MTEEQTKEVKISPEQLQQIYQQEMQKFESSNRKKESLVKLLLELNAVENALTVIKKEGKNGEILIPLGAGYYIEGIIKNSKKVKSYITEKIVLEKKIEESLKEIKERKNELSEGLNKIQKEQNALSQNIQGLQQILMQSQRIREQQKQKKDSEK